DGGEEGLLGIAFGPGGSKLYASYTDTHGDTNIVEYAMGTKAADTATRRVVLFVHQPYANHNGGDIVFGADGMLWAGLGDGGGENYGWSLMEGTHSYNGGSPPRDYVGPVFDYSHSGGNCSVTGGYVYRGTRIPAMVGTYLFGDFCVGHVFGLTQAGGRRTGVR